MNTSCPPPTFVSLGKWINHYCNIRNITITDFCRKISEKNRNAVVRVINEEAKNAASLHVIEKISSHQTTLNLSFEEINEIQNISRRLENGNMYCDYFEEFWMLFSQVDNSNVILPKIHGINLTLDYDTLSITDGCVEECIIINSCFPSVVSMIQKMIEQNPKIRISHYIINEEAFSYIHNIRTILPLIAYPNYNIYVCSEKHSSVISKSQNYILIKIPEEDILLQYWNEENCMVLKCMNAFQSYRSLLDSCPFVGLKTSKPPVISLDVLVEIMKSFRDREIGKDIYEIGPDLCIRFYDETVLSQAFSKACAANQVCLPVDIKKELMTIHEARVKMVYNSNQTNTIIVSGDQMKTFCQTGVLTTNDINLAPFTIAERMQIILQIYNHLCNNPHFRLFVIRDDSILLSRPINITVYGNDTIVLFPIIPSVGWSAVQYNDNTAIEIHNKEVATAFIDFFNNELLANQVLPRNETFVFFKELLKLLTNLLVQGEN